MVATYHPILMPGRHLERIALIHASMPNKEAIAPENTPYLDALDGQLKDAKQRVEHLFPLDQDAVRAG